MTEIKAMRSGRIFRWYKYENILPINAMVEKPMKIYIVDSPNNSKEPIPRAVRITPKSGKQQGEVIAVTTKPIKPIFSTIDLFFIFYFSSFVLHHNSHKQTFIKYAKN